jgi:mono/diheme cytochrome c family protein
MLLKGYVLMVAVLILADVATYAEELDPISSRVPSGERAFAKAIKNPIDTTTENIEKGKKIFEGKGICFNCHGKSGRGDGPAGKILNPSPRDFTNPDFHKNRTDGEMFWVIKNGSRGPNGTGALTAMGSMIGREITEEEAWYVILYERSLEGKK